MGAMNAADALLAVGATARVTRLVVSDTIGDRYIRTPVEGWAREWDGADADPLHPDHVRTFVAHGLGCPHCVSMWAAAAVMAGYVVLPRRVWRWGAGVLSASAVVGHLNARID